MFRFPLRLVPAGTVLSMSFGLAPALAGDAGNEARPRAVDHRAIEAGRVVERIEIGRLGGSGRPVVTQRKLSARAAAKKRSFDVAAVTRRVAATATESCFHARPTWRRYNGFGRLSSRAWYYIEWCGRHGRVTRVMTLYCGGVGAQGFSFAGCSIRRGSTGYSRVNVSGTWKFPFKIGIYTLATRTITVSARHYATGRAAGTWWRYQ